MSWGHAELELDEDADERAVKRAYAKRLRTTRPDEDPAGFQQLHEAYQAALAYAKYRAQWDEDEDEQDDGENADDAATAPPTTHVVPVEPPEPPATAAERVASAPFVAGLRPLEPESDELRQHDPVLPVGTDPVPAEAAPARPAMRVSEPVPAPLDVNAFAQRVLTTAAESAPASFERWLELRPELWSLGDKPRIGNVVLQRLLSEELPIQADNFELLAECFRWNEVGSGLDPYDANDCRARLHRHWLLQPRNRVDLAGYLHSSDTPVTEAEARERMQRLTRPWHRMQALWDAWLPRRVEAMRDTLAKLGVDSPDQALPPLRSQQVAFWLALAQRGQVNVPRMQLALLRSACAASALMVFMLLLGVITSTTGTGGSAFIVGGFWGALALLTGGALLLPMVALVRWQISDERPKQRWQVARLLLVPALVITAFLLIHAADARLAGSILAWATMALALVRWWRRAGYQFQFNGWLLLALWPFLKLGGLALMFGEVALGIALLAWTVDAVTQVARQ